MNWDPSSCYSVVKRPRLGSPAPPPAPKPAEGSAVDDLPVFVFTDLDLSAIECLAPAAPPSPPVPALPPTLLSEVRHAGMLREEGGVLAWMDSIKRER
jgi:hypothetical protein